MSSCKLKVKVEKLSDAHTGHVKDELVVHNILDYRRDGQVWKARASFTGEDTHELTIAAMFFNHMRLGRARNREKNNGSSFIAVSSATQAYKLPISQ